MTAELLAAIQCCKSVKELDQIINFVKETKVMSVAVMDAIEESITQGFKIGKKVTRVGDDEVGEIIKYNLSTIGFYPGDRYPIIVKFESGTFEYGPESLTLV